MKSRLSQLPGDRAGAETLRASPWGCTQRSGVWSLCRWLLASQLSRKEWGWTSLYFWGLFPTSSADWSDSGSWIGSSRLPSLARCWLLAEGLILQPPALGPSPSFQFISPIAVALVWH